MFAKEESLEVKTIVKDVDEREEVLSLGKFDNIVISNFKPRVEIFKTLPDLLNKDGRIILVSFNVKQSQVSDFPRKFCLEAEEFKNVSDKLELIKLESFKDGNKHLDGYIFKKPDS